VAILELSNLLAELSSGDRLRIFYALDKMPMTLSEVSNEVGISDSESSRGLQRLCNARLLRKRIDGFYQMTNYGRTIRSFLPLLETSARNREFIDNHDMSSLPASLQRRLDELFRGELSLDFISSRNRSMEHFENARENAGFARPQIPEFAMPTAYKKLKEGIEIRAVFPGNVLEYAGREFADILGDMELRALKEVPVALEIFDDFAAIAIPGLDGNPDRNNTYLGTDPVFRDWCRELFEHLWRKGKPFDSSEKKSNRKV